MKITIASAFIFAISFTYGQTVIPLVDFNGFFKSFENGFFRQIEFQRIREFKGGDNVVGYVDNRGNLRVHDGGQPKDLVNIETEYTVSDNLLTWKIGETLNLWDAGELTTLTFRCGSYIVKDSLVVFTDTRFNTLNVYYNGDVVPLYAAVEDVGMADFVGENIMAFRDNGNLYKVFWQGEVYELDAWHNPIYFEGGTDILVFNDPIVGTFTIFENGEFMDLEEFHMNAYKAGRGIVVYENQNGDLMYYKDGEKTKLTNFGASNWDVVDDVVVWEENGFTYAYSEYGKFELARYPVESFLIKNNVVAFTNIMGGVDAYIDGKLINVTNQNDVQYEIYGNSVLVKLFNNSYIIQQSDNAFRI